MSWEDRPYAYTEDGYRPQGGARSWLGGLPPPGKAVKWIMIANVFVFVLCLITGGARGAVYEALEMHTPSVFHGQVWRLLTFTYVHDQGGIGHIFFNMLGLYMLGGPLERAWGARKFFTFYTLGGFAAVLMYVLVTAIGWLNPNGGLVGASGGVLAVLGAAAVLFPSIQIILVFFPVPIRTAVLIFTLYYGFSLMTQGANAGGDACHLAGMAFGVAWGYGGERWLRRWQNLRSGLKYRPAEPRIVRESPAQPTQDELDHILDKVHRTGISSLTRREKEILEEETRSRQRTR